MDAVIDTAAFGDALALLTTQWSPWLLIIPGLLIGLVAGAIPGFGPGAMLAILLPVSYHLDFLSSMILMTAVFTGGGFGVAIPSILINVPGSPASVATCFDGFPMTRKGLHNEALGLALAASVFGTFVSYLLLLPLINVLGNAVLALGPLEILILILWGLTLSAVSEGDLWRGLLAASIGILLATVGFSPDGLAIRGTLGSPYLLDGISVVSAMVGLFAVSEMLRLMHSSYVVEDKLDQDISIRRMLGGVRSVFRFPRVLLRGSAIGGIIGMMPGVGASISNLISYNLTRNGDPDPDRFGTGVPEGVVAAESANSSSEGGSMLTLLALGIPAGAATAILFAVFSVNNITGGPRFYAENKDIVYAIVLNNMMQAVVLFFVGLLCIRAFALLVRVPTRVLVPAVLGLAIVATYIVSGSMVGPITAFGFGVLGWLMQRHGYARTSLVVGLLLGRQLEQEALRTLQISNGNLIFILERPIAMVMLFLFVASIVLSQRRKKRLPRKPRA